MATYQIWVNQPFTKAAQSRMRAEPQDRVRAIRLEAEVAGDARAEAGSGGGCVCVDDAAGEGLQHSGRGRLDEPHAVLFPSSAAKEISFLCSFPSVILMHLNSTSAIYQSRFTPPHTPISQPICTLHPKLKISQRSCGFPISRPSIFHITSISHESREPPLVKTLFSFCM